jgi:hypothetical protein
MVAISIAIAVFAAMLPLMILLGQQSKATQEREHARRIAEARMNARLLRLNL